MGDLDPKELRAAFASYMTGVTVVTAKTDDGGYVGFTANSFTSVSLEPPLLLICPGKHLSSFDAFAKAENFAVNILAQDQEAISNRFASSKGDRFSETDWQADGFGSPIIEGVAACFSCSTFQRIDAGDHMILIGRVEAFQQNSDLGLGFANSGYFNLSQHLKSVEKSAQNNRFFAGALVEVDDQLLVQKIDNQLHLPIVELNDRYRAPLALAEYFNGLEAPVEIRQTYSVFDDPATREHYTFFRATAHSLQCGSAGEFVPIADLNPQEFNQPGAASMMRRFKSEFNNQNFGLFIGDTESGDVSAAL